MPKPIIFLGSSSERRGVTEKLASRLEGSGAVDVLPWYKAFDPGHTALEELAKRLDEVDFAALVLAADDELTSRHQTQGAPRDNVVFELGLFMGKLDRDRAFALVDESRPRLPSDLSGVTYIGYAPEDLDSAVQTLTERVKALGPFARIPRGTHIVDQGSDQQSVYQTITDAVQAASPGDVILVRPGDYVEDLVIEKPVEIIGVGVMARDKTVRLRARRSTAIVYQAKTGHGRLATIEIEGGGARTSAALDVLAGRLTVRGCKVTGRGKLTACVRVRGHSYANIHANEIVDSDAVGILVRDQGVAEIRDNLITGHAHSCVEVRDATDPKVEGNRIGKGRAGGIWCHRGSRGTFKGNDIYDNTHAGITIVGGSDPDIEGNRIYNGQAQGVHVYEGGRGTIHDNHIYSNQATGLEIAAEGDPTVTKNRIFDGRGGGIKVAGRGRGRINGNQIRANKRAGVAFMADSAPTVFSENEIIDGLAEGIWDEVGVERDSNTVLRNAHGEWVGPAVLASSSA